MAAVDSETIGYLSLSLNAIHSLIKHLNEQRSKFEFNLKLRIRIIWARAGIWTGAC